MRVAVYLRVSTGDQTTDNQLKALLDVAVARSWDVTIFEDAGISGAKGRDKRPALDDMLKQAARNQFDLIAAWSIDRLGRSLQDLVSMLSEIHSAGVGLYLHQQAIDTTTPSGKAMFQMVGVFAEFERSMIRERINAGLARARAAGKKLGRPYSTSPDTTESIVFALERGGRTIREVAADHSVSPSTVMRIKKSRGL